MSDAERGSHEYTTGAPTATVSSLKSEDSTEQLICSAPQKKTAKPKEAKDQSVTSKSAEAGSEKPPGRKRLVVFLGLAQVVLGALLVVAGAAAVVRGAALARVGAGLWAGGAAVVAGVVGVLAGINDCYGLYGAGTGSPLLTAFLALSLLCLACGNSAAVLAATGLQRDSQRAQPGEHASFEDEMQAWTPVLTNIALLIVATLHCVVCVITIYHLSKRVCPCFRKKTPFDHNQFDPAFKAVPPFVIHLDENRTKDSERARNHELCKDLEVKLQGDTITKKKEEKVEFGSANSKEKLVTRWLGHHHSAAEAAGAARAQGGRPERNERIERIEQIERPGRIERIERPERRGVRKQRPRPAPLMLLPAHPASTLGRMPAACVMVPPRYATLPMPPPPPIYYPVHDARVRRRRSPRAQGPRRRERGRERDSQLARSLERIHRKRRVDLSDAELKRTYTGLDRAYAEQFIAVIDESRHAAEQHDSLPSTATSDSVNSTTRDV